MIRILAAALLVVGFAAAPGAEAQTPQSVCARFSPGVVSGNVKQARLTEISGLVASRRHPGVYWTHNDSGGRAELFALRLDGTDLGAFAVPGSTATDWEDIAIGPKHGVTGSFLYVADIGNNAAMVPAGATGDPRTRLTIWRVAEPEVAPVAPGRALGTVERIDVEYPGNPEDAEAAIVDPVSGDFIIVTKSVIGRSRILVAPGASMVHGAVVTMTDAGTIQIVPPLRPSTFPGTFVTGADISADGSLVLLRTYQAVLAFPRAAGQSVAAALVGGGCDAPQVSEGQGEAIALAADGSRYVTISEGVNQPINSFAISGAGAPATTSTTSMATTSSSVAVGGRSLVRTGPRRPVEFALLLAGVAVTTIALRRVALRRS